MEDLVYFDGPDDGEDEIDQELLNFLLEMKTKLIQAINHQNEANFSKLIVCIRQKLISEPFCFDREFADSGILVILLEFVESKQTTDLQVTSDVFEILGMACVSSSVRNSIIEHNAMFFKDVIEDYLRSIEEIYARNLYYFLANFVSEPGERDLFT